MKLLERSYSSKIIRPRPVVHAEEDGSLLIITTSWGDPEHASRLNDDILKYVRAARADVEVTSPFEFLTCLSNQANYLRVAAMISNERFHRSENRTEFNAGIEVLILLRQGPHIAYAQIGSPHLLVQKSGQGLIPLSVQYEASLEMSESQDSNLPPLPQVLLGIDSSLNIRSGDFRIDPSDHLVVYAGSYWPALVWQDRVDLPRAYRDPKEELTKLTNTIAQRNPDAPFWLGIIALED
jgi:hypothetical protein